MKLILPHFFPFVSLFLCLCHPSLSRGSGGTDISQILFVSFGAADRFDTMGREALAFLHCAACFSGGLKTSCMLSFFNGAAPCGRPTRSFRFPPKLYYISAVPDMLLLPAAVSLSPSSFSPIFSKWGNSAL